MKNAPIKIETDRGVTEITVPEGMVGYVTFNHSTGNYSVELQKIPNFFLDANAEGWRAKAKETIELLKNPDKKINGIKSLREMFPDLGLKEAKAMSDGVDPRYQSVRIDGK